MSVASCIATVRAACSAAALSSRVVNMRRRITFGRRESTRASGDGSMIRSEASARMSAEVSDRAFAEVFAEASAEVSAEASAEAFVETSAEASAEDDAEDDAGEDAEDDAGEAILAELTDWKSAVAAERERGR